MVRDNLMSRYGRMKQILVVEDSSSTGIFEQPEHPKHQHFYAVKCSRLNVVSLVRADLHIKN